ncbi:MAG: protease inhibitor I42 family protein [Anaerolineae bacterium]|nr:protease inhibitor I42 family protein [Anaerolineae bacterium]
MKARWNIALCLIVVFLTVLGSASTLAAQPGAEAGVPEIQVTERDQGRTIDLKGEILALSLESNPATGYGWMVRGANARVVRQVGEEWIASVPGKLGAPGTQVLRFAGVGKGRTTLNLEYRRPWETDTAPARTFRVDVNVTEPTSAVPSPVPAVEAVASTGDAGLTAVPALYNWCDNGGCTPVRDQGNCGSCWAFGTVGPLESAILIQDGVSKDLSEQYLVSCNTDGWGCSGGWWAHDYHEWKYPSGESGPGAVYENDFRYTATDASCNSPYTHHETIADWVYIGSSSSVPSTDAIKQAIYDHGPVSAAVCVNTDFQRYAGGVFNPTKPCNSINHAIVLVGWDDSVGAWILRNSWGPDWGEDGYMRIAYGKSKVGYSANYVVYGGTIPTPTPEPTSTPSPGGTMHVSAIDMRYVRAGKTYTVFTTVTIVDENNAAVSNATVSLSTTLPGGSTASGSGATGADGKVTFSVKSKLTGTYTSEVTNVTHATYTYDPNANVITSRSISVP